MELGGRRGPLPLHVDDGGRHRDGHGAPEHVLLLWAHDVGGALGEVAEEPRPDEEVQLVWLGPNSIEKIWLEFRLEKPLEFWLEIPYSMKLFKNG